MPRTERALRQKRAFEGVHATGRPAVLQDWRETVGCVAVLRTMTSRDLDWFQALLAARGPGRLRAAPWFWAPAMDARVRHAEWLRHLLTDPKVLAVRTAHGGAIASPAGTGVDIDDFAVDEPERNEIDGRVLLETIRRRLPGTPIRVVVPLHESERLALAQSLDWLALTQVWWTLPLEGADRLSDPTLPFGGNPEMRLVQGMTGSLVMPPPVYQQERPVLVLRDTPSPAALHEAERWAASRGAAGLCVIATPRDDWSEVGYLKTTGFFTAN